MKAENLLAGDRFQLKSFKHVNTYVVVEKYSGGLIIRNLKSLSCIRNGNVVPYKEVQEINDSNGFSLLTPRVKDTRLARKMYKDKYEEIGNGMLRIVK